MTFKMTYYKLGCQDHTIRHKILEVQSIVELYNDLEKMTCIKVIEIKPIKQGVL